jgi:hypothetical protein
VCVCAGFAGGGAVLFLRSALLPKLPDCDISFDKQ